MDFQKVVEQNIACKVKTDGQSGRALMTSHARKDVAKDLFLSSTNSLEMPLGVKWDGRIFFFKKYPVFLFCFV